MSPVPIILQFSGRIRIKSQFGSSCVDFYSPIRSSCLLLRKHTDVASGQVSGNVARCPGFLSGQTGGRD